jgi:TolA-binding protein
MKKIALSITLVFLFAALSGAASLDDSDFRSGLDHYNKKNYAAAAKKFQEVVNKKPDATAYYLIGYSLYKLGKFSEAEEYFRQTYLIDPEFSPEKVGLVNKSS